MKIYKEKQFLIFDFEDGQTVKYDFATKTALGKRGNPVNNLRSQLRGMTMTEVINNCEDPKYAKFLKFVQDRARTSISNIGTILSRVPYYAHYEQIFSAGIDTYIDSYGFTKTINEIPKSLLKLAKQDRIPRKINNRECDTWGRNVDAHVLLYSLSYISLTDYDLQQAWSAGRWVYEDENGQYQMGGGHWESYFNLLITKFGYNPKSLSLYLDSLKTYEALESLSFVMQELFDYANMMSFISSKYNKYPRNFLTTHKIATRNYNRLKKEFEEAKFQERINKNYEYTYHSYKFIYPDCTQDIKDEAVQQNNCVASYIDDVIDGNCHIMFLRKKDDLNKSLVTIEIRKNQIVQAKRKFNEPVTAEDQKAIDAWNKKYGKLNKKKKEE